MATSPFPTWAQEMSPHHRGPTAGIMLQLAALVLVAVLAWGWFADVDSRQVDRKAEVSLCEERPHWSVCQPEPVSARR
jgi:hypothetical protein